MPRIKAATVRFKENFAFDLNADDIHDCESVVPSKGVLRGLPAANKCVNVLDCKRFVGATSNFFFYCSPYQLFRYNKAQGSQVVYNASLDAPHEYLCSHSTRERVFFSYADGLLLKGENNMQRVLDWSTEHVKSVTVVNDRVVALRENGYHIVFGECGMEKLTVGTYHCETFSLSTCCDAVVALTFNTGYALGRNCYKFTLSNDISKIKFETIARNLTDIAVSTVAVIGNKIIFATNDGLYKLHNDKVKRILTDFDRVARNGYGKCNAGVVNDRYALTFPVDGGYETYLFDVDEERCLCKMANDVADILNFENETYVIAKNNSLCRLDKSVHRAGRFVRSNVNFGSGKRKHLRRLVIRTKGDVTVGITDEYGERCYCVKGGEALQSVPVEGVGGNFKYRIMSDGGVFEVTYFELIAQTFEEVNYGN